jgi:hypothetical protein
MEMLFMKCMRLVLAQSWQSWREGGGIAHSTLPIGHISNRGVLGSQRMSCKSRQSVKKVKKSWKLQDFSLKSLQ